MKDKTIGELAKENPDKTYKELVKIQEEIRLRYEASKAIVEGVCITGALRKDLQQSPVEDLKKRIVELDNSLAIALGVNDSHQRYNGKLQTRVTELEEENKELEKKSKKLQEYFDKQVTSAREAGA